MLDKQTDEINQLVINIRDSPKYDHINQIYLLEKKEEKDKINQLKDLGEKTTIIEESGTPFKNPLFWILFGLSW